MLLTRSSRIATLTIAVVLFAVLSSLTSDCQAQRRRFVPGQELGRFLGIGHGAGYHCANAGQNTDYYNPYSAHNSMLTFSSYPDNGYIGGYSSFDSDTVPHASYTNRGQNQHSVFESLPGQTVQPRFEPAVDRTRKKRNEADFDPDLDSANELDFDPDEDFDDESDFGSSSKSDFDSPSILGGLDDVKAQELAGEGDGDFDSLKSTFDELQRDESTSPKSIDDGEGFLN